MRIQKGRQAPGQHVFGGRSVLQGHCVLLFRNRPLGLGCGAVLRGRGLHFGAGFLFVQNQLQQHHQQQQEQQQQQAQQLQSLNPEGSRKDVSLGAACFWRLFRPSVAWCFGVARGTLWKPAAAAAAVAAAAAAAGPAAKLALFL